MKIYTEVNWQWSDDEDKLIEVSSESYDFDGGCDQCGGGKKKRKDFDADVIKKGQATYDLLKSQFDAMSGDDNYFSRQIESRTEDVNAQKEDAMDQFHLMQKQEKDKLALATSQGERAYGEIQRNTEIAMEQQREPRQ